MLLIDDISFSIAGRPLFEHASAVIPTGHKVGLVGPNGAGKTTLFRLIRGELALDGGHIDLPARARVGGIAQEAAGTSASVLDTVLVPRGSTRGISGATRSESNQARGIAQTQRRRGCSVTVHSVSVDGK